MTAESGPSGGLPHYPIAQFFRTETRSAVVVLAAAAAALVWANVPAVAHSYGAVWQATFTVGPDGYQITSTVQGWIDDGLMAVFLLVVGLEIKREAIVGELASKRLAALPMAAALGGVVVPVAIYLALNPGGAAAKGWGVPMATDIALALSVVAIAGPRVPASVKVFLTALAAADDVFAVLEIVLFHSHGVHWGAIAIAAVAVAALILANVLHVRAPLVYLALGVALWILLLESGLHATIAGVVVALAVPARTRIDPQRFSARARRLLDEFERGRSVRGLPGHGQIAALEELAAAAEQVQSPMQRLEHELHPWTAYLVVPLFVLAHVGLTGEAMSAALQVPRVAVGTLLGLLVGKQLGIVVFSWLAVRLGLAELAPGLRWRHVHACGLLAGIGFTMSLFVATLSFSGGLRAAAVAAVLIASLAAAAAGWLALRAGPSTAAMTGAS
jgi:NhaA family Na+:H+ antiporter